MALNLLTCICAAERDAISALPPETAAQVLRKGASGDYTKVIDSTAEAAAVAHLEGAGFRGRLVSEELGERRFGADDYPLVVLDPIDGTTNATRGISFYSISVAIADGPMLSDVYAGAVLELPSGRLFTAERGRGALLDGRRIRVNGASPLGSALIGVDLNVMGNREKFMEMAALCVAAKHVRNMGSAAIELSYVASGALDLYADNRGKLRVTDIAAALLILKEAGGTVLDLSGKALDCPLDLKQRVSLVAGHSGACAEALSVIRKP